MHEWVDRGTKHGLAERQGGSVYAWKHEATDTYGHWDEMTKELVVDGFVYRTCDNVEDARKHLAEYVATRKPVTKAAAPEPEQEAPKAKPRRAAK